jgi:3-hydroxyanthranilate 3,4-dioxygenase
MYLHPPRVPHSPQRSAGSVGLVVERKRLPHEKDGLQWYCDRCTTLLYEEYFSLHDVEKDFPPVFDRFFASADHRTCRKCGAVMPAPSR